MKFQTFRGVVLIIGSICYFITNGIFTPLLPTDIPWTEVFASNIFLARLSLASLSVFLLLIGAIGLHRHQSESSGSFGSFAFGLLFTGSILVFAHEWGQVFFLHELAKVAPEGLEALENRDGFNLYDIEVFPGLVGFMLGWILLAVSMLKTKKFSYPGPTLILIGLFAAPILGAALPFPWGFVVGNLILASGWLILGLELVKSAKIRKHS
ncbi:MAG: hypothetical protein ABJG78_01485 [Cyclobacteriaceae bacterium]